VKDRKKALVLSSYDFTLQQFAEMTERINTAFPGALGRSGLTIDQVLASTEDRARLALAISEAFLMLHVDHQVAHGTLPAQKGPGSGSCAAG
jgi:hypothetical protein